MTRLKLDWLARPAPGQEYYKTFRIMLWITITYIIFSTIFSPSSPDDQPHAIYNIVGLAYSIFMLVIMMKVRRNIRDDYQIPEERCVGCEDFCCVFWCHCCTVSQLARQTADYDIEDARYFTNDGLRQRTPVIIV